MNASGTFVERTRLLSKLEATAPDGLTLIVGGPGYGKSSLLEQWLDQSNRPICIARLTESHNSVPALGKAIAAALTQVLPEAQRILDLAPRADADWICDLFPHLVEITSDSCVTLVLDDVHHIQTPSAKDLLRGLVHLWPSPNSLVLAGRRRPAIGLFRFDFTSPMQVIGEEDLNFDADEIRRLLALTHADAQTGSVEDLLERTGGWPAGVGFALAAHELDANGTALHGSKTAQRYLEQHIVAAFNPDELDFLEHIATVLPAGVEVIDEVLNRNDSVSLLRMFIVRGLPMLRVDDVQVQMHSLLADLLRNRMQRSKPARMRELLEAASRVAIRKGELGLGLTLLHRTGDRSVLTRALNELSPVFPYRNERLLAQSWIETFGPDAVRTDPVLVLPHVMSMLPVFESAVRQAIELVKDDDVTILPVGATPKVTFAWTLAGFGFEPVQDHFGPTNEAWLVVRRITLGFQHYAANRFDDAERVLHGLAGKGPSYLVPEGTRLAILGIIASETGRRDEAIGYISEAQRFKESEPIGHGPQTFILDAAIVRMERLRTRWEQAIEASTAVRVKQSAYGEGKRLMQCWTNIEVANLSLDLGEDPAIARKLRDEANEFAAGWSDIPRLRTLLAELSQRIGSTQGIPRSITPQRRSGATLSTAEMRILRYLPSYWSLPRIAKQLHLSNSTVKSQTMSIYRKLGVNGREDAVRVARSLGFLADLGGHVV